MPRRSTIAVCCPSKWSRSRVRTATAFCKRGADKRRRRAAICGFGFIVACGRFFIAARVRQVRHPVLRMCKMPLMTRRSERSGRRLHANRYQRSVRGIGLDAARGLPFTDERRLIACRPAIGGGEDFVAAAAHRAFAAGEAVSAHHPDGRAGRALLALWSRGAGLTGRARRTDGARFTRGALRSRSSRIAFRPLAAARERHRQHPEEQPMCRAQFLQPVAWSRASAPHI